MENSQLVQEILRLKKEKNAIILAHYYTRPEIQEICDFLGDSLELSKKAAACDADIIVFCGVQFMAETAAVLAPSKKVLIPVLGAGCSLADGATGEQLRAWKAANPNGMIVSYVNTTADVKAETDICCTSSNALKIVENTPADKHIVFVPDNHLGSYIAKTFPSRNIELWNANCYVHHRITSDVINAAMAAHPGADVLIHPEAACSNDVDLINNPSCFFYSTSGILNHAKESSKKTFLIATELGIMHKLAKECPGKEFIPVSEDIICDSMKLITLENLRDCLLKEQHVVHIESELATKAVQPILKMMK